MAIIEWEGHKIEFIPILSHKTLWLATINELWIDGQLVTKSGGFNFSSKAEYELKHNNKTVKVEVKSSTYWRSIFDLNYELLIDGKTINKAVSITKFRW